MSISVFVSSTSEDLKDDCRPCAIRAVQTAEATPITMETWDTDYSKAGCVCEEKIRDASTHYLGIIAYRRGYEPDGSVISITEAEFDWAVSVYRKPAAILLPDIKSDFDKILRQRAATEPREPAEKATRQTDFIRKIWQSGTYMPFIDPPDLAAKVTRKVMLWGAGGLLALAASLHAKRVASETNAAGTAQPDFHQVTQLGAASTLPCS